MEDQKIRSCKKPTRIVVLKPPSKEEYPKKKKPPKNINRQAGAELGNKEEP